MFHIRKQSLYRLVFSNSLVRDVAVAEFHSLKHIQAVNFKTIYSNIDAKTNKSRADTKLETLGLSASQER